MSSRQKPTLRFVTRRGFSFAAFVLDVAATSPSTSNINFTRRRFLLHSNIDIRFFAPLEPHLLERKTGKKALLSQWHLASLVERTTNAKTTATGMATTTPATITNSHQTMNLTIQTTRLTQQPNKNKTPNSRSPHPLARTRTSTWLFCSDTTQASRR